MMRLPPVRQQLANEASFVRRQALQHIFQVRVRVLSVELGRLDQAHHGRGALTSAQ